MATYQRKSALNLRERLTTSKVDREPLVEGFLYKKSVLMISADPGCGKSTITACAIAQMSAGLPVFGFLVCPKPVFCYYIPFERGAEEILERLKNIESSIPFNEDNIRINEEFIGYNVIDPQHANEIIFNIRKDCAPRNPELIIMDPIYAAVSGGLSTDDRASQFTRFSMRLQKEFDCSIWMNHHTTKDSYSSRDGIKIEKEDPFYGSQWLKAHCTAAYYMRKDPLIDGVILLNKKDSHGNLIHRIPLGYNHEDYTSFVKGIEIGGSVRDRLLMTLRTLKTDKKSVTFEQIRGSLMGVSHSHLRRVLETPPFNTALKKSKSLGQPTLYTVIEDL